MFATTLTKTTAVLCAALFLPLAGATAQDEMSDIVPEPKLTKHVLLAAVRGEDVTSKTGEKIGSINDLVIDTKTNRIAFAVISTGGFLGVGERLTAVPYEMLSWHPKGDTSMIKVELDKKNLEMAPSYDHATLSEHIASKPWREETRAAFSKYPESAIADAGTPEMKLLASTRWRRASKLIGRKIVVSTPTDADSMKHETFGQVKDLVLLRQGSEVVAVLVSRDGIRGVSERRMIIPCKALVEADSNELCVNRSPAEMTKAPHVGDDVIARLDNAEYVNNLEEFYGVEMD